VIKIYIDFLSDQPLFWVLVYTSGILWKKWGKVLVCGN